DSGDFVWNAGIFVWNVKTFLHAFQMYLPEMADIFKSGNDDYFTEREETFIGKAYSLCGSISIDYGIMEKANNVFVLLTDFGWSDLGTWKSLYDISDKDEDGNVVDGNSLLYDSTNMIIKTSKNKLVVVQGLDNYIVAENDHVIMICHKDQEQKVKEFLSDVKSKKEERFI
ncbi:MAG: mannose-1-phosphate guanylyltransferase, partial [Cytophagales bacterium]|nr:mannose-1-phosphate guanylyltransferase [Cytophagales bacterium]